MATTLTADGAGAERVSPPRGVEHDPRDGRYVVASGWAAATEWYRNVRHTPEMRI
jgi:hypothetical protein